MVILAKEGNSKKLLSAKSNALNVYYAPKNIDLQRVAAIVLSGGQGSRLYPLTMTRCKPAICFGGKYRLIDVPVSNALNSKCFKIFILTQFLSASLHQHILKTYRLDQFNSGFIELLSVEQKPTKKAWYEGTADAVRQNLEYLLDLPVDYFLILSGDQLYHMNYQNMLNLAIETNADLVISAIPVDGVSAKRMGILKIDEKCRVCDFYEKPQEKALLEKFVMPKEALMKAEIETDPSHRYLGSMGIYVFKREVLIEMLEQDNRDDFGKHLIPSKVQQGGVHAYIHKGYWEDIGTIESFFKANIALTSPFPDFNCHDENNPIYCSPSYLPGPKINDSLLKNAIICDGSFLDGNEIKSSIIGPRTILETGTTVHNSYLMGNDFYVPPLRTNRLPENTIIEENCEIKNCIIDKNVHLGKGVKLINKQNLKHYNGDNVFIRDGITIVTRGTTLPDGFTL